MVALVDPLPHALGRCDVEHQRDLAPGALAPNLEPGLLKDAERRVVDGQHLRVEAADSPLRSDRRELLQQPRRSPAPPEIVSHRKRDLGNARLEQTVIARHRDHTLAVPANQRHPVDPAGLDHIA